MRPRAYRIESAGSEARLKEAAVLVNAVFRQSLASDYSEEGKQTFLRYVTFEALKKRVEGESILLEAVAESKVVGVLEMRKDGHLSLLFVQPEWQQRGIAKALLGGAMNMLARKKPFEISVNASLRAVSAYRKMGFLPCSGTQEKDGIQFVPMRLNAGR